MMAHFVRQYRFFHALGYSRAASLWHVLKLWSRF